MPKLQKGFTLIELLIVIAVLGILAVAVLSAINPIEQINRSKDTGSQSDAEQLISAIDRYYAGADGLYPWQTASIDTKALDWVTVNDGWVPTGGAQGETVLSRLSTSGTGELKSSFTNRITATGYNFLLIYNGGSAGQSNYVCFLPKSNNFLVAAGTRCGAADLPDDYPAAACPEGCAAAKACYSCLP